MPFVRFAAPATPFGFPAADPFVDILAAALSDNQSPCAAKARAGGRPSQCAPRRRIVKRYINPDFDVSERENEYVLEGELPGVSDKSSISIDFEDAQTIVIKGEVARPVRQQNTEQALVDLTEEALQASAAKDETKTIATDGETIVYDDAASTTSSKKNPHHVTVEDEVDESETASNASFEVVDGPVLTKADKGKAAARDADVEMTEAAEKPVQPNSATATPAEAYEKKARNAARYWISERSIGVFERKFKFQGLIDQDNVRANLENGLLTIVVPKREAYIRQVFIN